MRLFARGVRHPLYPHVKPARAARARGPCAALTGTCGELAAAAAVPVERAVFPLVRSPFLPDEERDALWARFRVPVQAILVDERGVVIGYECEAQQGFHLAHGRTPAAFDAALEETACDCGRPGPRLMPLKAPAAVLSVER